MHIYIYTYIYKHIHTHTVLERAYTTMHLGVVCITHAFHIGRNDVIRRACCRITCVHGSVCGCLLSFTLCRARMIYTIIVAVAIPDSCISHQAIHCNEITHHQLSSPHLASPRLASPRLASPHLTSHYVASRRVPSRPVPSGHIHCISISWRVKFV